MFDNLNQVNDALDYHLEQTYKPDQAYDWALKLAKLEGMAHVFQNVEDAETVMTERGDDRDRIDYVVMATLVTELEGGAGDTWSGRGNDRRRSYFDGVCEAARTVRSRIERENRRRRDEQN